MKIGQMFGDPCVSPDTKINIRREIDETLPVAAGNRSSHLEETISFRDLAARLGIDDLDTPEEYDIKEEGYEILSFGEATGKEVWKPLEMYVVKKNADTHYQLNTLHGTADHRLMFEGKYVRLEEHPGAELVNSPIQVVDCQVADTHCYVAEGQINHNTTTAGGMAIPYSSSVRIRLDGGSQIKDKDDNVLGINVTARTIKNKIAKPFRKIAFRILFGKGIFENDEIFDLLRLHCKEKAKTGVLTNGKRVLVDGEGAWKTFTVSDDKNGDVETEVKFYKQDFTEKVLDVPAYTEYVNALMDAALVLGLDGKVEEHATYGALAEGENSHSESSVEDLPAN